MGKTGAGGKKRVSATEFTMKKQAEMPRRLGIIAGGGVLPVKVAAAARAAGRGVFIVGLEGFADPAILAPWPHEIRRLGAASRIIAALARERLSGSGDDRTGAPAVAA